MNQRIIQIFRLYMWIAILVTLVIATVVFYGLAKYQRFCERSAPPPESGKRFENDIVVRWNDKFRSQEILVSSEASATGLYLFDEVDQSLLSSYSMLVLVSLPKMPSGWSLRVMTGWWYIYCILVTVAYRASMTAILANPSQKVTIDTLEELAASSISCGGWGEQTKELFTTSLDTAGQRVGEKFQVVTDANDGVSRVADGSFAYYENIFFLHYAKVMQKLAQINSNLNGTIHELVDTQADKDLHIMGDCAFNMPISIGLQKNSPLKPRLDIFLQRVIEAGLVKKWLQDAMKQTTATEAPLDTKETKALMDLKKFQGALVALGVGYFLSIGVLLIEIVYWYRFVKKSPFFDKYFMDVYFSKKK